MYTNYAVTAACVAAKNEDMVRARRDVVRRERKPRQVKASSRMNPFSAFGVLRSFPTKPLPKQQ